MPLNNALLRQQRWQCERFSATGASAVYSTGQNNLFADVESARGKHEDITYSHDRLRDTLTKIN